MKRDKEGSVGLLIKRGMGRDENYSCVHAAKHIVGKMPRIKKSRSQITQCNLGFFS